MSAAPRAALAARVRPLGPSAYEATWRAMQDFTAARTPASEDELWLTEHPPIYTLGLAGRREHLLRDNGIAVLKVDRGGQVTYHGPGQLVVYTLIDIARAGLGIRDTVRRLERAVIRWLALRGVEAHTRAGAPGVYVIRNGADAKIAALGLKVSRGCTYHGLALNVAMDLSPFSDIDPCGYRGLAVTQLRDLGVASTVQEAGASLAPVMVECLDETVTA
ncbi:MAG: lipoyl(octanoyl) transferase LipB [Betaproteobacteria bacterium]